jgi:hypothetical protein
MKKMILKCIVSLSMAALAALTVATASAQQTAVSASNSGQQAERLEGLWDTHVILTDCHGHTIAEFRAFKLYNRGGTLNSVDNTPPTGHGPGEGTWQYLGGRNYSAPFQFFNFNPDGSFRGVSKIERKITLDGDADEYTSVIAFESLDPNGNVVVSGCGTETATRVR